MAEMEKYNDEAVEMLLKHAKRLLKNDHNKNIVENRSDLNYSIGNVTDPLKTYKEMVSGSYLYGRGTKRELEANTCVGWVITLPKSVSDYGAVDKNETRLLNPEKERMFFEGVYNFVSDRYGSVFYNRIHYDEVQPHIHIWFVPRTKLDPVLVQNKTTKTHHFVRLESGRYEYQTKLQLDENGEKIPIKNYSHDTQYYDTKISCADVMNKAELQHFHGDLAAYLKEHNIPGADSIYTGATGGNNLTVKTMKEFEEKAGFRVEEIKDKPLSYEALKKILAVSRISKQQKLVIENINSEALLKAIEKAAEKNVQKAAEEIKSLKEKSLTESVSSSGKYASLEAENKRLQSELEAKDARIKELEETLEKEKAARSQTSSQGWGQQTQNSSWGQVSGWGNKEEIKSW